MSSTPCSFPTEVIERIIDIFGDISRTLQSFALSCRALLPRARLHLFTRIRICTLEQTLSVSRFIDDRPWHPSLVH
ncbi:hypothetical protein BD309DRAFT_288140 [Dichomitus squalens]|uniref:Uncharacterized protein n=1 Tax=Dichomitus squalens TaxID=114155 RepID=A0A4Q9NL05_9APHY|nr:hypothetical protein BD309DRAFT_288140 [Dichomitus squalens]TBU55683.1 hypothetical protein BD310DRAFT_933077 [Dichomitus squalens]